MGQISATSSPRECGCCRAVAQLPSRRGHMPFRGTPCAARHAPAGRGPLMEAEALSMYTTTMDDGQAELPVVAEAAVADLPLDKTFRDFGIAEAICAALETEGITTAFP